MYSTWGIFLSISLEENQIKTFMLTFFVWSHSKVRPIWILLLSLFIASFILIIHLSLFTSTLTVSIQSSQWLLFAISTTFKLVKLSFWWKWISPSPIWTWCTSTRGNFRTFVVRDADSVRHKHTLTILALLKDKVLRGASTNSIARLFESNRRSQNTLHFVKLQLISILFSTWQFWLALRFIDQIVVFVCPRSFHLIIGRGRNWNSCRTLLINWSLNSLIAFKSLVFWIWRMVWRWCCQAWRTYRRLLNLVWSNQIINRVSHRTQLGWNRRRFACSSNFIVFGGALNSSHHCRETLIWVAVRILSLILLRNLGNLSMQLLRLLFLISFYLRLLKVISALVLIHWSFKQNFA